MVFFLRPYARHHELTSCLLFLLGHLFKENVTNLSLYLVKAKIRIHKPFSNMKLFWNEWSGNEKLKNLNYRRKFRMDLNLNVFSKLKLEEIIRKCRLSLKQGRRNVEWNNSNTTTFGGYWTKKYIYNYMMCFL